MRVVERLVTLALTVAAVCSVMFLLQLIGCRQTHLGVMAVADFDEGWTASLPDKQVMRELSPIPANLFAEHDRQALLELAGEDLISEPSNKIEEFLRRCVVAGDWGKRDVLAVYTSLYALETSQGIRVIPSNADPDKPQDFYPLERLTTAVRKIVGPLKRPVLLVLDVSQFEPNWRMGSLSGLSMREIKGAFQQVVDQVPGLVVMCSCDDYERSWSSPDLGMSVFTYFVIDALNGSRHNVSPADSDGDGTVRVGELFQFVRARVNSWALDNRDPAGQHPILIPDVGSLGDRDFSLSMVIPPAVASPVGSDDEAAAGEEVETPVGDERLDRLLRSWSDWDEDNQKLMQDAPLYWRVMTHQLLFAQRGWRARSFLRTQRALEHFAANRRRAAWDVWDLIRDADDPQFIADNVMRRVQRDQPDAGRRDRFGDETPGFKLPEDWFAHYKKDLPQDVPQSATLDRVRNLRDLAESAAIGSLGTWTAVRRLTRQADVQRRLYEDRLFTGVGAAGREADRVAAEAGYQRAVDVQQAVSEAQQLLNRLYCLLPELARWSAFRCRAASGDDPDLRQTVALLQALAEGLTNSSDDGELSGGNPSGSVFLGIERNLLILFRDIRSLARGLDALRTGDDTQLDALRELTNRANDRLQSVLGGLNGQAGNLAELTEFQWNDYRDLAQLLECPIFAAEDRRRFLLKIDEMSSRLNKQYIDRGKSLESRSSQKLDQRRVVVLRMWRAMWALQTVLLAERRFSAADPDVELWMGRWRDRSRLKPETDDLLKLIDRVRRRFVEQRRRLLAQTESRNLPVDLDERRDALRRSDRLARVLHAPDAVLCLGKQLRPTRLLREFQIAELCAGLAGRYLDDYWKQFYPQATTSCLSVAKGVPGFGSRIQQLKGRLQLRRQAGLRVRGEDVEFGTDKQKSLRLSPEADAEIPAGRVAVWIAIRDRRLVRRSANDQSRREWVTGGESSPQNPEFPLERQAISDADCPVSVRADLKLFFRGHTSQDYNRLKPFSVQAADLNPCPSIPDRLSYHPPDNTGKVVVLGTDKRSLIFVLDCSHSMKDTESSGRWTPAVKTLRDVVYNLANGQSPDSPQHSVGLMALGHRLRRNGLNPDWNWKEWNRAPWNLRMPPTAIKDDFEMLLPIRPLLPGNEIRYDNLFDEKKEGRTGPLLKPYGLTPLYGALIEASKQFQNDRTGTLVVITDGLDTHSTAKPEDVKLNLERKHVDLYVLGYLLNEAEKARYRELRQAMGGEFVAVNRPQQMAGVLSQAVQPREFQIQGGFDDIDQGSALGTDVAGLPPGDYQVSFPQRDPVKFRIQGGERLKFEKDDARLRLSHLQGSSVKKTTDDRPNRMADERSLGYKRFVLEVAASQAVLDVCLFHKQTDGSYPGRPEEIHIEVSPVAADDRQDDPKSVDFQLKPNCSVPTWTVRVGNWPGRSGARVRAWWKPERTPADMRLRCSEFPRAVELPLKPRAIPFNIELEHRADIQRRLNQVVVSLVPTDRQSAALRPRAAEFAEQMRNLRLDLVRDGQRQDLEYTREYYRNGENLVYRFELPNSRVFIPDEWNLEITTISSRKDEAQTLEIEARDPELR